MKIAVLALMSAAFAAPACAQMSAPPVVAQPSLVVPVVAVARPSASGAQAALPANSEIWVSPNAEVNSKSIKQGGKFEMSVSRDVILGDYVVIPRGTRAIGQISYRTGKGAFGKSAKMEFEVVEVDLGGRIIPVKGHYRVEGQGNTGAAVGAVIAVGVFGAFVTGHSAVVAQGTEFRAYTTDALPVTTAAPVLAAVPAPPAAEAAPLTNVSAPGTIATTAPAAQFVPVSAAQPVAAPK